MRLIKHLLLAAGLGFSLQVAASSEAKTTYVPVKFRTVAGIRPFVEVRMGGQPFLLMVHSNAAFTMMTTHANAEKAGVKDAVYQDSYGISTPGHVSALGRSRAVLPVLEVGDRSFSNVPINVFEVPQDVPMDGMLGLLWLHDQRVILDYDQGRFGLPETPADAKAEDDRLIAQGYIPHRLTYDAANRGYEVDGQINGHEAKLFISTVGENIIDTAFAGIAGIPLGPAIDTYSGPTGTLGSAYIAKRNVEIVIDGQRAVPDRPRIYDTYAYDAETRPATAPDSRHTVRLGADFFLANQAVIDFGTGMLFLRPASATQAKR